MRTRPILALAWVGIVGLVAAGVLAGCSLREAGPAEKAALPAAAAGGEKLVPLEIKLPKPMFQGTPKNIKPAPTLEKYSEKPRPPFLAPEGVDEPGPEQEGHLQRHGSRSSAS